MILYLSTLFLSHLLHNNQHPLLRTCLFFNYLLLLPQQVVVVPVAPITILLLVFVQVFQLLVVFVEQETTYETASEALGEQVPVEYDDFDHEPLVHVRQPLPALLLIPEISNLHIDIYARSVAAPTLETALEYAVSLLLSELPRVVNGLHDLVQMAHNAQYHRLLVLSMQWLLAAVLFVLIAVLLHVKGEEQTCGY